jgi:hypothetical protein
VDDTSDFLETATIIANCDLVIISDTAVARLAGGKGKIVDVNPWPAAGSAQRHPTQLLRRLWAGPDLAVGAAAHTRAMRPAFGQSGGTSNGTAMETSTGFNLGTVLLFGSGLFVLATLFFGTKGGYYDTDDYDGNGTAH